MTNESANHKLIYNLEFPSFCKAMEIYGYRFQRVSEYQDRVKSLHHTISSFHEFQIDQNTGNHAITAVVNLPSQETRAVLPWGHQNPTPLDDILLLLSIFTCRQVFALEPEIEQGAVIVADPRDYFFGLSLRTSIPYEPKKLDEFTEYDIGFEKGINQIYQRIRDNDWLQKFGKGYFLFLFRAACRRQILETSFIVCWSIWEHLFFLHNRKWLSMENIRKLPAKDKIAFLLTEYKIKDSVEKKDRKGLERFAKIRNHLVHTGSFPNKRAHEGAELFIRVTERLVAQILGLTPSDVLGTLTKFDAFLSGEQRGFV
jgi:hypothetical protein